MVFRALLPPSLQGRTFLCSYKGLDLDRDGPRRMLRELHISNLAIIEDLRLELTPGLNVFTGQTGAGKSLILGAFELLLGRRSPADLLRPGAAEGRVSGVFEIPDAHLAAEVHRVADLPGADTPQAAEGLLITRKIFASGRSSASINGHPVTAAMLREVGDRLIDLHIGDEGGSSAAGEAPFLLRPSNQLAVVDAFAGSESLLAQYADLYRELIDIRTRLNDSQRGSALRTEQLDLLEFQAGEIDAVEPTPGEYDELSARHRVLSEVDRLTRQIGLAHNVLYDSDESVASRLQAVVGIMRELVEIDPALEEAAGQVEAAAAAVQDASFVLGRYLGRLDLDPAELGEITDRLNALNRLIAKYGRGSLDDVLEYREEIRGRIGELSGAGLDSAALLKRQSQLAGRASEIAAALRAARQKAARALKPRIEAELAELAMAEAQFDVQFEPLDEPGPTGADQIEMMIRTNPGQPSRPLRRIASGGELSRIMLALKTVLAGAERISVLVFDEIDAKIGGRLGSVIGAKLRALAQRHQVLCITHLPQIAAFGDTHLRISKHSARNEIHIEVATLGTDAARRAELAEMLAGKSATEITLHQADELLATARHAASRAPDKPAARRQKRTRQL